MRWKIQSLRICSPFCKGPTGERLHLPNTEKLDQDYKGHSCKRLKYVARSNNSPSVCCQRLYLCLRKDCFTSGSSKEERKVLREIFMTKLTRGSGWGQRNVLHRAAGSWKKAVQELEARAKDFDNVSTNTDSGSGDEIMEDCQLIQSSINFN